MIVFDTARRYMEHKGYEVNYVSNFTDVDDKIIKKANEEGVEPSVISERYIEECRKDMKALNVHEATTDTPMQRRTVRCIIRREASKITENFHTRIWMI